MKALFGYVSVLVVLGIGARAAEVNLFTPEMQQLRNNYVAEKTAAAESRLGSLRSMISEGRVRYDQMLDRHKVTGNIPGLAVARTGISTFEDFLAQLDKTKDFTFPPRIRRELEEHFTELKQRKAEIDAAHLVAVRAMEDKHLLLLADLCRAQGADVSDPAGLKKLLADLAGAEAPGGAAEPGGGEKPAGPGIVGESGSSSNWVPFARWHATVNGIEILEVSVAGVREKGSFKGRSVMGKEFEVRYEPIREIAPVGAAQFMVRALPGKQAGEVIQWPSARNRWTMAVRLRPDRGIIPSEHGFELFAGYPGVERAPLVAGADPEASPPMTVSLADTTVKVRFLTQPDGAAVYVNGARIDTRGGPALTPCEVDVPEGKHTVTLKKTGYEDVVLTDFAPAAGQEVARFLRKDPRFVEKALQVSARGKWRNSGIELQAGDIVSIEVEGLWSCGSKGEMVGPEGYPNSQQFYHYYIRPSQSPRQDDKASYGALLMRIGIDGRMAAITARSFRAAIRTAGTLYFDINEAESARTDNVGALTLTVHKGPAD